VMEEELVGLFSEGRRGEARAAMDRLVEEKLTEAYEMAIGMVDELSGVGGEAEEEEAITGEEETAGEEAPPPNPMVYVLSGVALLIIGIALARGRPLRSARGGREAT
jgi:hypothetical protein